MPEGSQKFASESIFNFNFIFELKFEFRVWEHLVSLGLVVFARFFKNQKKPNKAGWFIGDAVACFFLRLTYRRDRPGPAGTPKKGLRQVYHYPNLTTFATLSP